MMWHRTALLGLLWVVGLGLPGLALADVIHLKNGNSITVRAWRDLGDAIEFARYGGVVRIRKEEILRIESDVPAGAPTASRAVEPAPAAPQPGPTAERPGTVLLRWKLPESGTLGFKVTSGPVDPKKAATMGFDVERLPGAEKLSPGQKKAAASVPVPETGSLAAILTRAPGGKISVKMIVTEATVPKSSDPQIAAMMAELAKKMQGTVQLRGEITDSGEVASGSLPREQKNLLVLYFGLPKAPVKAGDTWSLDVDLVTMGAGFIEEESKQTNRAELVSLTPTPDGDTVAVISYAISEDVKGRFVVPQSGQRVPSAMSMSHVGRGEFLVKKGIWKKLVGRMRAKATGLVTMDGDEQFVLDPMASVPAALLKLE